jgi:formylglycine-generating enzyme required for sulfatase activity
MYNFGDDASKIDEYAWHKGNAEKKYHQVGQKKPNAWGLYDMHGNVTEWCLDVYDKSFYEKSKQTDPKSAPVLIPTNEKYPNVARGGSWKDDPKDLRSAARRGSKEVWSDQDPQLPQSIWWHSDAQFVGFRIVHPIEEQENLKGLRSKVRKND